MTQQKTTIICFCLFLGFYLVNGDVVVLLGGKSDDVYKTLISSVNAYSNKCGLFDAKLPALPNPTHSLGAAYLNGFLYVCGGYDIVEENDQCFKLDLNNVAQGWIEIQPMLKGRFNHGLVAAQDQLLAIGGQGPMQVEHQDIEIYDPQDDTWTLAKVNMTGTRYGFCASVDLMENNLYLTGGIAENGQKKRLEILDLDSMTWTRGPDMTYGRSFHGCTRFGETGLIVAGGWGDQGPLDKVELFDSESWQELPAMNQPRAEFSLASHFNLEELVTAFGGFANGSPLDSIETFNHQWSVHPFQIMTRAKSSFAIVTIPETFSIFGNC